MCIRNKNLNGGHVDELHDTAVISISNACPVFEPVKVCSVYMCVLYMVFWSDSVFEFFLALFLAEFNPQLSSLENLWNKSEFICVTDSLRLLRPTNAWLKLKKRKF